jgi:chemotaxis-related protein WspD
MNDRLASSAIRTDKPVEACWSRIGVRGDKSCALLPQHTHCRNCPTYSAAGATILDARSADNADDRGDGQLLSDSALPNEHVLSIMTFRVGTEYFGLPVRSCREVVESRSIHSLPHRRHDAVRGLANVRGTLLICLSPHVLLNAPLAGSKEAADARTTARLLVVESDTGPLVMPVDEVCGVVRYEPDDLKPVPVTLARSARSHTQGLLVREHRTIGVLDTQLVARSLAGILT